MNSYDQQRDVETEAESLKRYDDTVLYYENRIENCKISIASLKKAQIMLQWAQDEYIFLPSLDSERLCIIDLDIENEILKLSVEKSNYEKELENINKGSDDL